MTSVVVDASIAFAWILPSQRTVTAEAVRARSPLVAPVIFPFEVRAGVLAAERRQRLTRAEADRQLGLALPLVDIAAAPDISDQDAILATARRTGLAFYDAAYLHLALVEGCELASRDAALLAAAGRIGVQIVDAR